MAGDRTDVDDAAAAGRAQRHLAVLHTEERTQLVDPELLLDITHRGVGDLAGVDRPTRDHLHTALAMRRGEQLGVMSDARA